jgi:glycosyltransferase involved in cell wall biosynthesis
MSGPLFSILTPVFDPPVSALIAAIESVRSQELGDWELILVDDCSTSADVRRTLQDAAADPRIRVEERSVNGGIVAASNDALALASGTFIALLDHDDLLAPGALARFASQITQTPDVDYLYSDEDKVDADRTFFDPFIKPEWSPERLRGQMYTGHLSVLRTSLVRDVGGFAPGSSGSQDHDLVLRVTERARRVVHIPEVLYHWRSVEGSAARSVDAKPYAWHAGLDAVQRHLDRSGVRARAKLGPAPGTYHIERWLDPQTAVSLIIPTRGSRSIVLGESRCLVVETVRSIIELATHPNFEIVVVYDAETGDSVLDALRNIAGDRLVLVPFEEPFNFSAKCNVGFIAASGQALIFMNDDMQVVTPRFIEELVAPLREFGVGATGARLLFADGTLQHGGHVYASGDLTHAGFRMPGDYGGPFRAYSVNRECSGLTAACLAVTRSVFEEVGGFCEQLPGNFNDVDMSRKIRRTGRRMLWIAQATLYHFESLTRDPTVQEWEYQQILARWGTPPRDPYFPVRYR